jgi:hypothetical protein
MNKFNILAAIVACSASIAAQATQQCFTTAGVYGAVTITEVGAGCAQLNPFTLHGRTGFVMFSGAQSCTIGFSKPLVTSSITVDIDDVDSNETTTVSTSAGAYTVIPGDLTGPLAAGDPGTLSSAGGIIGSPIQRGSGTFSFTNTPPASITSLTLTHAGAPGTFYRVCADDAGVVAPTSVPTLSEWGLIILSGLMVMATYVTLRRRNA